MLNSEIANEIDIRDLIGIPFKVHGRDMSGLDCYGLAKLIEERRGNHIPEYAYEGTEKTFCDYMITDNLSLVIELDKPEPFCVVTFSLRPPWVSHLGVLLDDTNYFIHVMSKRFVAIERLDNIVWKNKIRGYYRWKSLE